MGIKSKALACIFAFVLIVSQFVSGLVPAVQAETKTLADRVDTQLNETIHYLLSSSEGEDDWDAFAFYLAGEPVSRDYVERVEKNIGSNRGEFHKTTDLARTIIGLRAAGQDPTNINGINLIEKLYQREKSQVNASNDAAWALIALDSNGSFIPDDAPITREYLVSHLVHISLPNGGWGMDGTNLDPDITGMVMTALASYQQNEEVKAVLEKAADGLKGIHPNNSNSIAQMIIGLKAASFDPASNHYTYNDQNLVEQLLDFAFSFQSEYKGQFRFYKGDSSPNTMATQQALFALAAYQNGTIFQNINGETAEPSQTDRLTVNILPLSQRIEKGEMVQLEAEVKMPSGDIVKDVELVWSSSNNKIAKVSQDGMLTALEAGTTTITVQLASDDRIKSQLELIINEEEQPLVHVIVEGPQNRIAQGQVQTANALQALERLLTEKQIVYDVPDSTWGKYIHSIAGIAGGTYGGYDGWSYLVKRGGEWIYPETGIADFELQKSDRLYVYYGDSTAAVQSIEVSPSQPKEREAFTVTVGKVNWVWNNEAFKMEEQAGPASEVAVTVNGTSIRTDENGQAAFLNGLPAGDYDIKVTGYQENKAPVILQASQSLSIKEQPTVTVTVEGPQSHIAWGQVQETNALQALEKLLKGKGIVYEIIDSSFGPYIHSIDQMAGGAYGGWDGWSYMVKREGEWIYPDLGISTFELQESDQLYVFYSNNTGAIESIEVNPSQPEEKKAFTVTVQQATWIWNNETFTSDKQIEPASNVKVTINGTEIKTDENGRAVFSEGLPDGNYEIEVTAYQDQQAPTIMRATETLTVHSVQDSPSNPKPNSDTVTISVRGDDQKGTILSRTSIEIESGDTVYDVLIKAIGSSKVEKSGSGSSIYISGIDGLHEFDRGPESGWMFSVNGEFIDKSSSSVKVYDGDVIKWEYTSDLGKDIDAPSSSGEKKEEVLKPSKVEEKPASIEMEELLEKTVKHILTDSYISDWEAFALAKAGIDVPASYMGQTEKLVKENKGVFRKITDTERIVLAVKALGYDPTNFAGYNLLENIYHAPSLTNQGTNGLIFALVALDHTNTEIPKDAKWTRENIVSMIVNSQYENGGIPLATGEEANIDITAMALAALAPYKDKADVKAAIEKGVQWLSDQQLPNGGYQLMSKENSSSISQTIIALTSLGIDPRGEDFTKKDGDLVTRLLDYGAANGGFKHMLSEQVDAMATEQALMAIEAYKRFLQQEPSLYDGGDIPVKAYKYHDDHQIALWAKEAVYEAKEYRLMEGYDDQFHPKESLTRAQFTKMLVSMLGEQPIVNAENLFTDVESGSWYEGYVLKASEMGFIQGFPGGEFKPDAPITRQQIAIMITRAFSFNTDSTALPFVDIETLDPEALSAIGTVVENEIMLGASNDSFSPHENVTREMAALISVRLYEDKKIK